MAAAFRKFLRSSSAKLELGKSTDRDNMLQGSSGGGNGNGGTTKQGDIMAASPKLQPERGGNNGGGPTCRLFAKACSTMQSFRDATKVCPAENVVLLQNNNGKGGHNHNHHHVLAKKASKVGGLNVGCAAAAAAAAAAAGAGGSSKSSKKKNAAGNGSGGCGGGGGGIHESSMAHAKLVRTRRLMREFQDMCREQQRSSTRASTFTVELADDNLYEWNVKLHRVDPDSDLYRDMRETKTPYILLNLTFPDNFPFAPPFMRVISPHIEKGFVMEGGAICMELLTPSGWASAYTVEAIVMQFSASLVKGQGRIAKKTKGGKDFNRKTAEASFRSLVKTHEKYGWVTPPLADG